MKNNKWSVESFSEKPIHVVLFVSRNKDNKNVEGFKERRTSFLTTKTVSELEEEFNIFVNRGVKDEMSRFYYSVNKRDPQKIHKELLHFLIESPDFNLCSIMPKLAGIGAKSECRAESKWMFDFDNENKRELTVFLGDLPSGILSETKVYRTPHGYAIVTPRGFDTRGLGLEGRYDYVTLKRDDLLCVGWDWKTEGDTNE